MDEIEPIKRVKIKLKRPNPLFEKWLLEWHEEETLETGNTDTVYIKALESLKKFPLVLNSAKECIILENFDESLCKKIENILVQYKENGQNTNAEVPQSIFQNNVEPLLAQKDKGGTKCIANSTSKLPSVVEKEKTSPKKKRTYIPTKRSAAYAIMLTLLQKEKEENSLGYLTKAEIITFAQKHCDVSFKKPMAGSFYSGWSSMSQLVSKSLVEKFSNPAKFKLTEEGRKVASKLNDSDSFCSEESQVPVLCLESASELIAPHKPRGRKNKISHQDDDKSGLFPTMVTGNLPKTKDLIRGDSTEENGLVAEPSSKIRKVPGRSGKKRNLSPSSNSVGSSSQSQEFETQEIIFLPDSFEIILLVDCMETEGKKKKDEDEMLTLLTSLDVKYEVRGLKIGDYVWIARDHIGREMVLPYIIERKRLDDLEKSIKDGRFHEQKFRLKLCGLQNKIYLVENCNYPKDSSFMNSIYQAITNTLVCDRFSIKITNNIKETTRYLNMMTTILKKKFHDKTLFSCKKDSLPQEIDLNDDIVSLLTYVEFSHDMERTKDLTAREQFALQLVQLSGMSGDKAWAITQVYPTPVVLIEGFLNGDAEKVISELRFGLRRNKIGPQLSSILKMFYTSEEFPG